eukprot:SAG22_NODE_1311_length_4778_cov_14.573199_2_plen_200_part_00
MLYRRTWSPIPSIKRVVLFTCVLDQGTAFLLCFHCLSHLLKKLCLSFLAVPRRVKRAFAELPVYEFTSDHKLSWVGRRAYALLLVVLVILLVLDTEKLIELFGSQPMVDATTKTTTHGSCDDVYYVMLVLPLFGAVRSALHHYSPMIDRFLLPMFVFVIILCLNLMKLGRRLPTDRPIDSGNHLAALHPRAAGCQCEGV